MPRRKPDPAAPCFLASKSREEIAEVLKDKGREDLIDLVHRLVALPQLVTAAEIAERSQIDKEEVLADMRAGRFRDDIFGAGFFCRSRKGSAYKVTTDAVTKWMRRSFVPASSAEIPVPVKKKNAAAADTGVNGARAGQRAKASAAAIAGHHPDLALMPVQAVHLASLPGADTFADTCPAPGDSIHPGAGGVDGREAGGARATGQDAQKISTKGLS